MMLAEEQVDIKAYFKAASEHYIVIPAFNVPHLPMLCAISDVLCELDTFALIEVSLLEIAKFKSESWAAVASEYRKNADRRFTSLHADHIPVIDEDGLLIDWQANIREVISLGYRSLMIDASRLPLDENIRITAGVVEEAHSRGLLVEAELGQVAGHEKEPSATYKDIFESKKGFTVPEEAGEFVAKTGVDLLSIAIGNIHGPIAEAVRDKPKVEASLDIDYLKRIRSATGIPLVIHGGSGIKQASIDKAIQNGITKINIAAAIRKAYEFALREAGTEEAGRSAVRNTVRELILDVYGVRGSATRLRKLTEN